MSTGLAEDHLDDSPQRVWLIRVGVVLGFLALVAAGYWAAKSVKPAEAPKRQVAKISILPDTPPPPPPPKPELKKPEPLKDEPKQVMRDETVKQAEAPKAANEPIKMEGAAGDGPSAFAAGGVSKEYSGGAPVTSAAATGTGTSSDRAQERFYANSAKQLLRDEIERRLRSEVNQATAEFSIWVERDGGISRFELLSTGDKRLDGELRAALNAATQALKLPPPPLASAQPMKFRLSLRPMG
ncbi:TonB C-terminal domain-containing protein [Roseateles sp.]|uniref:TonB C-terminal domain-containing protein n=1 Tax=Roseateles sp. TaxID=1971397 RepID=UPI003BA6AE16